MNALWLDRNWKKLVLTSNIGIGAAVVGLSVVDIYLLELGGVMSLLRLGQLGLIGASGFALAKDDETQARFLGKAMAHPLIQAMMTGDTLTAKQELQRNPSLLNHRLSSGESILGGAALFGCSELVGLMLGAGANPKAVEKGSFALMDAARGGSKEAYDAIRKKISDDELRQLCLKSGFGELLFAAYEGNLEKVLKLATRANVKEKTVHDLTALHMAVLGARSRGVVEALVELGADSNAMSILSLRNNGTEIVERQKFSPSLLAIAFKDVDLALFFHARSNDLIAGDGEKDHVMMACELGLVKYVEVLKDYYDWNRKDRHRKTALDYAKQVGNQPLVNKITQSMSAGQKGQSNVASQSSKSANYGASTRSKANTITRDEIDLKVAQSLDGLVGFDNFVENFSHELADFLKKQPGESKGIVVWGDASVGKSELGQRLAGLKQEYNIPSLDLEGVDVKYIACCDGDIDIAKEAAEASSKSVIILDEVDKFFNPKSGIVDEGQAKKLRTSIVTNFQNKPIFWIFMGTFHDLRGKNKLNEKELSQVLGTELTSRLDFADWQLPSWTLESLLQAGQHFLNRDAAVVNYEDDAIVALVQQALGAGGGVRQLQKYHDYFKRQASKRGQAMVVTQADAEAYMKMLNAA